MRARDEGRNYVEGNHQSGGDDDVNGADGEGVEGYGGRGKSMEGSDGEPQ